jgi:hypothetical protein
LLCYCWNFSQLKEYFPEIMTEAAREDPADIAVEWQIFANEFYLSRGNPVPDCNVRTSGSHASEATAATTSETARRFRKAVAEDYGT